ncbi:hypothetical protein [Phormidesmis priestleyi]|uniref:hypothetical protein n=2 Tax=Phormidesmis priestleyi TaxID=268141 RepID=UPI000AE84621|nr:hypothetical protein [Phormidesmis priestleyi]
MGTIGLHIHTALLNVGLDRELFAGTQKSVVSPKGNAAMLIFGFYPTLLDRSTPRVRATGADGRPSLSTRTVTIENLLKVRFGALDTQLSDLV